MSKIHKDLENGELHPPKDFSTANNLTALTKNTTGQLVWVDQNNIGGQGPAGPPGPGDANTVSMDEVAGGGSINNLQSMHTRINSAGIYNGGGIVTDNGDGTVGITAGQGLIRAADDISSNLLTADFPAVVSLILADNEISFIYAQFNGGTPSIIATTIERTDFNTNVLYAIVFKAGTSLSLFDPAKHIVGDAINSVLIRLKETRPFERASGGNISATGTRNFSVTAGKFWEGLTDFNTNAIDTSGIGTFTRVFRDGAGGFTQITTETQIDNLLFDDGSGTLATLSNNLYGVRWVFVESDSDYLVMMGQGDFTLSQAQADSVPAVLPKRLQVSGRLVGKIIIQKSAAVFTAVESAFVETFEQVSPTDHNQLINLQGGLAAERFHLNQAEMNAVNKILISAVAAVDIDMSGDKFKTKTITENTVFTISNPILGSVVQIRISGNFTITLPATVANKSIENEYAGTKQNNLFIECVDAIAPRYLASIIVED